jgi:hypothetical protein
MDLVAVAAAVFVLDDVPGRGEAGDDAVGAAVDDAQARADVAQPGARVAGDAEQDGRGWSGSSSSPYFADYSF